MTNSVSLFEAKAHLSELVRQVAASGQEVAISVRGRLKVRIVPYDQAGRRPDAWEARERAAAAYGEPDYVDPPRRSDAPLDPFAGEA
jgi:prevent-host-death family protein